MTDSGKEVSSRAAGRHRQTWGLFAVGLATLCGCGDRSVAPARKQTAPAPPAYFRQLAVPQVPDFVNRPHDPKSYFMPDIMGSGVALWDYDGDDDLDILLLNGGPADEPDMEADGCRLFRHDPGLVFTEVTDAAGLRTSVYAVGVAIGDVDNDGDLDCYISAYGPDELWRNNGDGKFTNVTDSAGVANVAWGTAASFVDYDGDGRLDLFVGNYVDYYAGLRCEDASGRPDFCNPKDLPGTTDRLFRNITEPGGDVRFVNVTVESGLASQSGRALGVLCRDFDGDGRPDIYVANDMDPNFLWIQQPDGTFQEEGFLRGLASNLFGDVQASMGVAVGDFQHDSFMDVVVMNLRGQTSTLYAGQPGGVFTDNTPAAFIGPATLKYTTFGVAAIDLDCDGDLDMAIVNGSVMHAPGTPRGRRIWDEYAEANLLFRNDGTGRFENISPLAGPFTQRHEVTRALAYGDLDRDGDLDLVTTQCDGPVCIYLNEFPRAGNWLSVRAIDPELNREAIGARLAVRVGERVYQRELNPSESYLTSHESRVHFGLGKTDHFDEIIVKWPDGVEEVFAGGATDEFLTLSKGSGLTRREAAAQRPADVMPPAP
ncbi:MAG: CRTAC1 family protein [Pirellulaceae bacterium]